MPKIAIEIQTTGRGRRGGQQDDDAGQRHDEAVNHEDTESNHPW
ncbi:hypothetical protein [Plantibacter flavus]|nr:hypothetical protein [Plantibacter flavus]